MALSPMMTHYLETKKAYPDCLLFYRLGDFYEMFFEDARLASKELELTLTGKECGLEERAPMCGVPFHAADSYINRLSRRGFGGQRPLRPCLCGYFDGKFFRDGSGRPEGTRGHSGGVSSGGTAEKKDSLARWLPPA